MDRALNARAPNASVLKLYAEIMGLVGRNAITPDNPDMDDDSDAWAMIEGLPPEVHRYFLSKAESREARRRRMSPEGDPSADVIEGDHVDPVDGEEED
jgi:hypothetical protein